MRACVGVLTGVLRKVVAIAGTSRQSVKDNSIRVASRLCQQGASPDNGAPRGLDGADDKTNRLDVFGDELSVADGINRGAI